MYNVIQYNKRAELSALHMERMSPWWPARPQAVEFTVLSL